jgi:hypothetical protein
LEDSVSKLLDSLEQISRGNSKPMGFASAAARAKLAGMVIIAALDDKDKAAALAGDYADAILVNSFDEKNASQKSSLPWGLSIQRSDDQIAAIEDSGCDFVLMNSEESPIGLLQKENLCRIIEIDPVLPDGLIRAISQLPVDAALISGDTAISMKRLLTCQHIASMVGKHLLIRIPLEISHEELRELWEIGTTGVVVAVSGDDKKGLAALRKAVDALPAARRKRSLKPSATIPSIAPSSPAEKEEPDEDE